MNKKGVLIQDISREEFFQELKKVVAEINKNNSNAQPAEKLLSQTEACQFLGVAKSTIIRWEKHGKIQPKRVEGRIFYMLSDLINIGGNDD